MRIVTIAAALVLAVATFQAGGAITAKKQLWGAIAFSSRTEAFGYAVDKSTKRAAETEASRQCGEGCDVIKSFRNACGAVAKDAKRFFWATGATRAIAEQQALAKCKGSACTVAVWACTSEK